MSTKTLFFLIALLIAIVSASQPKLGFPKDPSEWTPEERAAFCDYLPHTLAPFRCQTKTDEEIIAPAMKFIKRHGKPEASTLNPVILTPGLASSVLDARLEKNESVAWYCFKHHDWFEIWVAFYELAAQPCWFDNLHLQYDIATNGYQNASGVEIAAEDFGGLSGIDYLCHSVSWLGITGVYNEFIKNLEEIGYEDGTTLFGAPFDWRMPLDTLMENGLFDALQNLVEYAYTSAGGLPVNIVTHSMGGPTWLYFLNRQPISWVNQYIANWIPMSGPWSGASKALRAIVSGDNFGIAFLGTSIIGEARVANMSRTAGGLNYMTPDTDFWPSDYTIVQTPSRNYTSADFQELYTNVGSPEAAAIHGVVGELMETLTPPYNISTYCLYGYGLETEISYVYDYDFNGDPSNIHNPVEMDVSDLGDGTVPLLSLRECQNWAKLTNTQIKCREYDLRGHADVLKDEEIIYDVLLIVTGRPNITTCEAPVTDSWEQHPIRRVPYHTN